MPFAPKIRKQILEILNKQIIPQLQESAVLQLLFEPPFDFRGLPFWTTRKSLLPENQQNPLDVFQDWSGTNVTARRFSELSFSYRGVSEESIGITQQAARALRRHKIPIPAGITTLNLPTPAAFYVPPLMPHGGRHLHAEDGEGFGILVAHFSETEFFLRYFDTQHGVSHYINITEPHFRQMELDYRQLLRNRAYDAAQRHLLNFMFRLCDYLTHHKISISNSAWPIHDRDMGQKLMQLSPRDARLCSKLMDYVQFHINEPITMDLLAQVCQVTPQRIGQVFTPFAGISPMRYVTMQRLNTAKLMLISTQERMADIAQLTGFASPHSFAVVFKRHHGMSPSQFRRLHSLLKKTQYDNAAV